MLFFSSFIVTFTSIGDYFQENKKTKLNSGTFPFLYKNRPAQPPYFLVLWILLFLTFYATMNRTGESASVFFFLHSFKYHYLFSIPYLSIKEKPQTAKRSTNLTVVDLTIFLFPDFFLSSAFAAVSGIIVLISRSSLRSIQGIPCQAVKLFQ